MARRPYPTDLSDREWELIEPLLPKPKRRGPKPNVNLREIVNAICYRLHEGCQWRALPHDFPPWSTVSSYFRKWQRQGIWSAINHRLRQELHQAQLLVPPIDDPIGERYLLMWEEPELNSFSIAALELLGLTKREAEVLFWVAQDQSNAAIAKVLGCRQGTVRKHLEHIHRKLGVQTRTAAVIVALEKLGLLKATFVAISS
ncbi:MAG: IS5 family transposase [Coleofasciculus sp. C1-SOL-03]|jgi:transposase|uniref:IS5 family transposase n=1 Tax=Coleofasciculus sp. C1-SOL-03 TaxID=3069522 RepID=UPI0032F40735